MDRKDKVLLVFLLVILAAAVAGLIYAGVDRWSHELYARAVLDWLIALLGLGMGLRLWLAAWFGI